MKHVGKMKNNGARIAVAYRTLPGDSGSALVIGTGSLPESWHDTLMSVIQDPSGQQANELADILAVRKFPDGSNILTSLHSNGHLKKVPTSLVLMTPTGNPNVTVPLSELNQIIAEQRGCSVDDLAIRDGSVNDNPKTNKKVNEEIDGVVDQTKPRDDATRTTSSSVNYEAPEPTIEVPAEELSPTQLRSKADKLFKEAQALRKQADAIDPPKAKAKKEGVEA
jgi:hypothetical protein